MDKHTHTHTHTHIHIHAPPHTQANTPVHTPVHAHTHTHDRQTSELKALSFHITALIGEAIASMGLLIGLFFPYLQTAPRNVLF